MNIEELMSSDVVTASENDTLNIAGKKFKEHNIRHLPVLDSGDKLVGIFSDRDLKRVSASDATILEVHELLYLLDKVRVAQVMTKKPFSAPADMTIEAAAGLLAEKRIGCLPVLRDEKVVGIITKMDFVKFVAAGKGK